MHKLILTQFITSNKFYFLKIICDKTTTKKCSLTYVVGRCRDDEPSSLGRLTSGSSGEGGGVRGSLPPSMNCLTSLSRNVIGDSKIHKRFQIPLKDGITLPLSPELA